jgi:hypothetical protein
MLNARMGGRGDGHIICDWLAAAGKGRRAHTHKHMPIQSKVGERWVVCWCSWLLVCLCDLARVD